MNRRYMRRLLFVFLLFGLIVAPWVAYIPVMAGDSTAPPPAPDPTAGWIWNPPGVTFAPILLYHHVADRTPKSRYFVRPQVFEEQVRSLKEWGYTSIPVSMLVEAVREGAELPPEPVVFTFDDAYRDVYTNAFPIMKRYGFTGVVYVIAGQIGEGNYMSKSELQELVEAGWEIGSHGWTHTSLRSPTVHLEKEIFDSRQALKELFGKNVKSFAFPYGLTSKYVTGLVKEAGYRGAVGLGISYRHTEKTLYYLSRLEVRSNYDLKKFAGLLPWVGDVDGEAIRNLPRNARGMEGE